MNTVIQTATNGSRRLQIERIEDYWISPRDYCESLGHIVCWCSNYDIGEKHTYEDARALMEDIAEKHGITCRYDKEGNLTKKCLEQIKSNIVILPIYMLDHSGISISVTPFGCPWDSGQIGFVYCTKKEIVSYLGREDTQSALKIMIEEVETYNNYMSGDHYGWSVYTAHQCEHCNHTEWELDENCCGYFTRDIKSIYPDVPKEYQDLVPLLKDC